MIGSSTLSMAQTTGGATMPSGTKPAGTAASMADCEANLKAADANGDGRLVKAEIDASKSIVPIQLANAATINKSDFLNTCSVAVTGQKN